MDVLWLALRFVEPPSPPELSRLACWAGTFTPRVSLADDALLLEIGGCLRLFGGLDVLHGLVTQGLAEQDVVAHSAVAATPQAALWLAEGDSDELDALSITDLSWPAGVAEKLTRFGLRRLGEVRRLPSGSLARRIGKAAATLIARAYGEAPDPWPDFVFPLRFDEAIELPAVVENAPALMFAARRLTGALAGWLNVRQAGLRECRLDLVHHRGATPLPLRFAEATRDGRRFERVLRERLERLTLTAPVERLRLVVESVDALPGASLGLFDEGQAKESMAALIERLRARLGDERVFGIVPVADHRPECATHRDPPADKKPIKKHARPPQVFLGPLGGGRREAAASGAGSQETRRAVPSVSWPPGGRTPRSGGFGGGLLPARPFWLLPVPLPLAEIAGRPHCRGPLKLLAGPERIESGWWQTGETTDAGVGDLRRDYFIALTRDARWAWVFRELRPPGGWFLHGWFA